MKGKETTGGRFGAGATLLVDEAPLLFEEVAIEILPSIELKVIVYNVQRCVPLPFEFSIDPKPFNDTSFSVVDLNSPIGLTALAARRASEILNLWKMYGYLLSVCHRPPLFYC